MPGESPTPGRSPWEALPGADRPTVTVTPQQPAVFPPGAGHPAAQPTGGDGGWGSGDAPTEEKPGGGRRRVLIAGGVLGIALVAYAGAAYAVSSKVARDTTVGGVELGGLGRSAAVAKLEAAAAGSGGELQVKVGDKTAVVDTAAAKLAVDAGASVDDLVGYTANPVSLWKHVSGGGEREAVLEGADELPAQLAEVDKAAGIAPKDASIAFAGTTASITPAVVGTTIDVPAAADLIRHTWLGAETPIDLPTKQAEPKVTQAAAEKAKTDLADPALSGPLTLAIGDKTVSVAPAAFAPTLRIAPGDDGALALGVDGAKLREAVLKANPQIGVVPKDARFELRNGRPAIVPSVSGVTIDPVALADVVPSALGLTGDERKATVKTAVQEPELTTEKAQALGVKERVSTFSTVLTADSRRTENLRIAARTVNGTVVLPGETFSLNGVLGERTPAKGYNQAPAISGGRLVRDFGGGVSQMATTIFNNVFFAGLKDIYHKPHSFYISRYPEGREATVNWPTVDLKWQNDSKYAVLIEANVTSKVNVSFWSTKVWDIEATKSARSNYRSPETHYDDKPSCVTQAAQSGFDVTVGRIFKQNGREVKRESFKAVYIAEDKVVCGPKPGTETEQGTNPPPED